jgi:hypothetical protein
MTDEIMNLRTAVEKSADADLLREMIGFAAQRLMELEVAGQTGAAYGRRTSLLRCPVYAQIMPARGPPSVQRAHKPARPRTPCHPAFHRCCLYPKIYVIVDSFGPQSEISNTRALPEST